MIVLAYPGSGVSDLQRLLDRSDALYCTAGTSILPLCEVAAAAWRRVDDRDGGLTPLAVASIRALAGSLISALRARLGSGARWCEIAFSPPAAAEAFLRVYPATKVVCLHRGCAGVVRAGVLANPWGLAGTPYAGFAPAYPANPAATIAAYWAERTEQLLRFEEAHKGACLRVRHEDLAGEPARTSAAVFEFLGECLPPGSVLDLLPETPLPENPLPETPLPEPDEGSRARIPAGYLPGPLLAVVNGLQERLGYPAIA